MTKPRCCFFLAPSATVMFRIWLLIAIPFFFLTEELYGQSPNVLVVLADDLGYSDLGCYGGEIETPNLDSLAASGIRFSDFYNTGRCWPTRASLLTGYYPHEIRFDVLPGDPPIRRGKRPDWAILLPEMLREAGYRSLHSGKWHLDAQPVKAGFDRSYSLDDHGRYFSPRNHSLNDNRLPPVEQDSSYYATTAIADHAISFLREHQLEHGDKPFFCYVAFTAPHFPLHALPEDIERYKGQYDEGWEQIRARRYRKIEEMGIVNGPLSAIEEEIGPPYEFPEQVRQFGPGEVTRPLPWKDLTEEQRQYQATKMTLHAAMVHRMDREFGRIMDQIRQMNCHEKTLVLFLSDNGASAELMIRDDGHDRDAPPGSAASHFCLGPGWSTVSNTPFRRHKSWVHEGGIRTPLIASWPDRIRNGGTINRSTGHVIDICSTLMELADVVRDPASPPLRGTSLVPVLVDDGKLSDRPLWWSHEGHRGLREGDWKIVAARDQPWELYNLSTDPTEQTNLIDLEKDRADELIAKWRARLQEMRQRASGG